MNELLTPTLARVTSDPFLAYFRMRWANWERQGFPNCDSKLLPIVGMLGALPGVIPTATCASHPNRGTTDRDRTFFINLAVSEQGLETLDLLTGLVMQRDEHLEFKRWQAIEPLYPTQSNVLDDRRWLGYRFNRKWHALHHTNAAVDAMVRNFESGLRNTLSILGVEHAPATHVA